MVGVDGVPWSNTLSSEIPLIQEILCTREHRLIKIFREKGTFEGGACALMRSFHRVTYQSVKAKRIAMNDVRWPEMIDYSEHLTRRQHTIGS
jgi:hypothetical protein